MKIFPAIDVMNGSVVRLLRGDFGAAKRYSVSAEEAAKSFFSAGASCIHAVDLDGAKSGKAENAPTIQKIISASHCFVEVGGGIRTDGQIQSYLSSGAGRVIIGTAAVKDFNFLLRSVEKYGEKIAVGVDVADGKVAVGGWREVTDINGFAFCRKLAAAGVKTVIYTDISRDGTLSGSNIEAYEKLVNIGGFSVVASGGVSSVDEISTLKKVGVSAVILGKSLYEGRINLSEALAAAEG